MYNECGRKIQQPTVINFLYLKNVILRRWRDSKIFKPVPPTRIDLQGVTIRSIGIVNA